MRRPIQQVTKDGPGRSFRPLGGSLSSKDPNTRWIQRLFGFRGAPVAQGSFMLSAQTSAAEDTLELDSSGQVATVPSAGVLFDGKWTYRFVRQLGRGGSGVVILADVLPGGPTKGRPPNQVAIKVLSPDPKGTGRQIALYRELSSLRAISNDRIPAVYDWRFDVEHPFVVMQYFPHGNLRDVLATVGALAESEVWQLLHDLLSALNAAHAASVLHLDIKPANVLIDDHGRFALTDFGISQGSRMHLAALPTVGAGTRGYQAPEQRWLQHDQFDMRTDLYSVGTTAWAASSGINLSSSKAKRMLSTDSTQADGLPPLSHIKQFVSPELEDVVRRLVQQEPSRRPGSAAEVLRVVEAQLGLHKGNAIVPDVHRVDGRQARKVISNLVDPMWAHVFSNIAKPCIYRFEDGEYLDKRGAWSHHTFILLHGQVDILIDGDLLTTEDREGTFLGEIATLTGRPRTASMRARGVAYLHMLNASELERLVTSNPAVGIRLIRSLAERLTRHADRDG